MIEFNPSNKTNKTNFTAKVAKGDEVVKPVENFLTEMISHVRKSLTDSRISPNFEKLDKNTNTAQDVVEYGLRFRPFGEKSGVSILEKGVKYRNGLKTWLEVTTGTKEQILKKLEDPALTKELDEYVNTMNKEYSFKLD